MNLKSIINDYFPELPNQNPIMVQIGANDGRQDDPFRECIIEHKICTFIRTSTEIYKMLVSNYSGYEWVKTLKKKFSISTEPNNYGSYQGFCPNHPYVYKRLEEFKMEETSNVISLIDDIYSKSDIIYRKLEKIENVK